MRLFLMLSVALACAACGKLKLAEFSKDSSPSPEVVEKSPTATTPAVWTPIEKAAKLNDIRLQIDEARIGQVQVITWLSGTDRSRDDFLILKVKITSVNKTKKLHYRSWGGERHTYTDAETAKVKDNHGNEYKWVQFGFGDLPEGGVNYVDSVYPESPVTDVLIYEKPIKNASYVEVVFPLKNLDSTGEIRFRIPMSAIQGRPEYKAK